MALDDLQHVEAVAIIRNLVLALGPREALDDYAHDCAIAGDVWLKENHPDPAVYMAALTASRSSRETNLPKETDA